MKRRDSETGKDQMKIYFERTRSRYRKKEEKEKEKEISQRKL